jgi:crotonobetainyl-CoA:carnitine CoA-transferase CaiB-like acyl-CoA transferase
MRPLDGLIVIDVTRLLPGAIATLCLADFGAEVIKIEQPGSGDSARAMDGSGRLFSITNTGKKSVAIDLKTARGKELFLSLAEKADILVESFRPGVMERLGLSYDVLSKRNLRLIYAAITGYGQSGPYAGIAGHDINYLAMSGLLQFLTTHNRGAPTIPAIQIADLAGGSSQAIIGILLALEARHTTGTGQMIDISMCDGLSALLAVALSASPAGKRPIASELLSGAYACYSIYPARNDRWIAVGALESKFWSNLCRELGREHLIEQQFAAIDRQGEMKAEFSGIFATRDAEEWFEILRDRDCCAMPVRTIDEAFDSGVFREKRVGIRPLLSRTSASDMQGPAPRLGEHSIEVLQKSGIGVDEIKRLERGGVIQCMEE